MMPEQTAQGRIVETATEARGGERGPSMVVVPTISTICVAVIFMGLWSLWRCSPSPQTPCAKSGDLRRAQAAKLVVPMSDQSRETSATGNQSDLGELVGRLYRGGNPMLKKLALAMATVGLLMSTASADYYIVQEKATKKCKEARALLWVQMSLHLG
jgi:hypothetical protein